MIALSMRAKEQLCEAATVSASAVQQASAGIARLLGQRTQDHQLEPAANPNDQPAASSSPEPQRAIVRTRRSATPTTTAESSLAPLLCAVLQSIPVDVLQEHLAPENLAALSISSRRVHEACGRAALWEEIMKSRFGGSAALRKIQERLSADATPAPPDWRRMFCILAGRLAVPLGRKATAALEPSVHDLLAASY